MRRTAAADRPASLDPSETQPRILRGRSRPWWGKLVAVSLLLLLSGCAAIEKKAMRSVASTLGENTAKSFASDPDAELVGQALPFTLKLMESLLLSDPENPSLLLSACSGFTQYSYAFVELEAERLKFDDYRRAAEQRRRSTDLYLRGRDYCFRALDLVEPGTSKQLPLDPEAALASFGREHMDLVYWTGASWGSAISSGRDRLEIVVDLPAVRTIFEHLLDLDEAYEDKDEAYEDGALHEAMISLEAVPETMGGSPERARKHYERAVELSGNTRVGSHLAWAWMITIGQQDRSGFEEALNKALAVNLDDSPEDRLANTVNRKFSRFLLDRVDELFLDDTLEYTSLEDESSADDSP